MNQSMRVEKHTIKENHKLYQQLDEYSFKCKNLYNYANYQIRQVFIITSKLSKDEEITKEEKIFLEEINIKVDQFNELKVVNFNKAKNKANKEGKEFKKKLFQMKYFSKDNKYLGYDFLEFLVREGMDYKSLMAKTSQQCLKLLDKNWKSFFEAIKVWKRNKSSFSGMPKLPKYLKKNGRNLVIFTNQCCKLKDNKIKFPGILDGFKLDTKVNNLQQVRILPRNRHFVIEVVYKQEIKSKLEDNGKYLSIDIGLDNLATICNNIGVTPIVINGKSLKSINQYYNKQVSHYRGIAKRMNDLDYTKRINRITIKRNNKINDYLHKASKQIVEYAYGLDCNTIVVGNNKDWKRHSSMSKKVNQNFVGIPHQRLIEMVQYKAEKYGINIVLVEESYTSGTSFLDGELPVKENYNKNRRVYRGLFKSNKDVLINADVNGAYQILKKEFPNAYANGIEGVGLHPIIVTC